MTATDRRSFSIKKASSGLVGYIQGVVVSRWSGDALHLDTVVDCQTRVAGYGVTPYLVKYELQYPDPLSKPLLKASRRCFGMP